MVSEAGSGSATSNAAPSCAASAARSRTSKAILSVCVQRFSQVGRFSRSDRRLTQNPRQISAAAAQHACLREPLDPFRVAHQSGLNSGQSCDRYTTLENLYLGTALDHAQAVSELRLELRDLGR